MLLEDDYLEKIVRAVKFGTTDDTPWDDLEAVDWPDLEVLDPVARLTETPAVEEPAIRPLDQPGFEPPSDLSDKDVPNPVLDLPDADVRAYQQHGMDLPDFNAKRWMKRYQNGQIPFEAMTEVKGFGYVRPDAAKALKAMVRAARKDGIDLTGSGYRDYQTQVELKEAKPTLAAEPGTSNHGWALAVDIAGLDYGTDAYQWLMKNGKKYGWQNPEWAVQGGTKEEPWHWEYVGGYKGSGKAKPKRASNNRNLRGTHRPADPLNRVESSASLVHAPTVFGSVVAEVYNPPQTRQEFDLQKETRGLGFVPKKYRNFFIEAGEKYGIAPRLLAAISQTESEFAKDVWNFQRDSSAGAVGPMQVMPLHQSTYGDKFMHNARENVMVGAQIFASYLEGAGGNLRTALAMYNAGPNASPKLLEARKEAYADPILDLFLGRAA